MEEVYITAVGFEIRTTKNNVRAQRLYRSLGFHENTDGSIFLEK